MQSEFPGRREEDDSLLGIGGMGQDEESQSIRVIDTSTKKGGPNALAAASKEDSNIVGINPLTKKELKKSRKANLKEKKKKKKKDESSEDEDGLKAAAKKEAELQKDKANATRHSNRINKNAEEDVIEL